MAADPRPFAEHFERHGNDEVVVFPNLGGDAMLVVPAPRGTASAYTHLARFVRHAPRDQVRYLWRTMSETVIARIGAAPLWLSTAGDAVGWLHVRLDSRPKYFHYRPYAAAP